MSRLYPTHLTGVQTVSFTGRNTVKLSDNPRSSYYVEDPRKLADYCIANTIKMAGKFAPSQAITMTPCAVCGKPTAARRCLDCCVKQSDEDYAASVSALSDAWMQELAVTMRDALESNGLKVSGNKRAKASRLAYYNVAVPTV